MYEKFLALTFALSATVEAQTTIVVTNQTDNTVIAPSSVDNTVIAQTPQPSWDQHDL